MRAIHFLGPALHMRAEAIRDTESSDRALVGRRGLANTSSLATARRAIAAGRPRPWIATVALPLAMNATMLLSLWWTWPVLIFGIWWFSEHAVPRVWLLGVQCGALGTGWCIAGTSALQAWPRSLGVIAILWIGFAVVLAAMAAAVRKLETDIWGEPWSGY